MSPIAGSLGSCRLGNALSGLNICTASSGIDSIGEPGSENVWTETSLFETPTRCPAICTALRTGVAWSILPRLLIPLSTSKESTSRYWKGGFHFGIGMTSGIATGGCPTKGSGKTIPGKSMKSLGKPTRPFWLARLCVCTGSVTTPCSGKNPSAK